MACQRTGRTSGSFTGWPGVGGVAWAKSTTWLITGVVGVWWRVTLRRGVPAWRYQRMNCDMSSPDASSKQARNCSTVAAVPSSRSK